MNTDNLMMGVMLCICLPLFLIGLFDQLARVIGYPATYLYMLVMAALTIKLAWDRTHD